MANVKATKVKKKKWYTIYANASFHNAYLGEVLTDEPSTIVGRPIVVNLMEITRDPKKQHIDVRFKVTSIQGEKAVAEPVSMEESPSYIKRLVRRKRDKIDNSFLCVTADNKTVRMKSFLLTFSNTKSSVRTKLQNTAKQLITGAVRKINFDTLMTDIVSYKFQYYIKDQLKKIYPLKSCDIRYIGVETNAKAEKTLVKETEYAVPLKEEEAPKEEVSEISEENQITV